MSEYRDDFRSVEKDVLWTLPHILIMFVLLFIGIGALGFLGDAVGLWQLQVFGTRTENVKRQIFEQSQSYIQGKINHLSNLRWQYQDTEGAQKEALRQMILTEASTVDNAKLPVDLQGFIQSLKSGGGMLQ